MSDQWERDFPDEHYWRKITNASRLPEGRRPLDDNWFITKANQLHPEPRRATMVSEKFIYPLTMNDYQADTAQFAIYRHKVVYPALGLANEAGEVLGKIKKLMRDRELSFGPEQKVSDKDRAEIADELGDVLWYIAALARDLGISMNELAHINVEKLTSRQKRGVIKGSGDKR